MIGAYDGVLDFGTSEHILNQQNVLAAIHATTKMGHTIMHCVPSADFAYNENFCYISRFFGSCGLQ
jgi:hypothetical protein